MTKAEKCNNCPARAFYSKRFDFYFDYKDCPFDCENKEKNEEEKEDE